MERLFYYLLLLLCFAATNFGNPTPQPTLLDIEEETSATGDVRDLDEDMDEEPTDEVDPRLVKNYPDFTVGPYECSTDSQCQNEGQCVEGGPIGKVCNCTLSHLGPYCDYTAASIDKALRLHPLFKVNFAECMVDAGKTAGIDTIAILSKCGSGRNMCWLHEGGVKGLKSFFWCLTSSMELSLTEATPSAESGVQLYAEVFQKLARESHPASGPRGSRTKRRPIASLQINLYDTTSSGSPYPSHDTIGVSGINIKPAWSYVTPVTNGPPPPSGPYDTYDESGRGGAPRHPPLPEDFDFPMSHEIPTLSPDEVGPVGENGYSPFPWDTDQNTPSDFPGKDPEPESNEPSDNFLNNALRNYMTVSDYRVVESEDNGGAHDGDVLTSPYNPFPDTLSNMRER